MIARASFVAAATCIWILSGSILAYGQVLPTDGRTRTVMITYALAAGETADPKAMAKAIESRLKRFSFDHGAVRTSQNGQFEIELHVKSDNELEAIKKVIALTESLELRILAHKELHSALIKQALDSSETGNVERKFFWAEFDPKKIVVSETMVTRVGQAKRNEVLVLDDELDIDGSYIQDVVIGRNSEGRQCLLGGMTGEGSFLMAALTRANRAEPRQHLAVVFNRKVICTSSISERITRHFEITGKFSEEDLRELATAFKRGGFPARLDPKPVSERRVGEQ